MSTRSNDKVTKEIDFFLFQLAKAKSNKEWDQVEDVENILEDLYHELADMRFSRVRAKKDNDE